MKKLVLPLIILSAIISSCANGKEDSDSNEHEAPSNDTISNNDTIAVNEESDNNITFNVLPDGPDSELYIENQDDYSEEEVMNAEVIDVIPYIYGADSGEDLYQELRVIARDNFEFYYGPLSEYSGKINMYYDQYKNVLACSWNVVNGQADGNCTLYDTEGNVSVERVYKAGKWQFSGKEPYAVDWTYDQASSSLIINDTSNAFHKAGVVELMRSFHDESYQYFDQIIDKKSFVNSFRINGDPFTGQLIAYQAPEYSDDVQIFELNFLDGYLHGDIKLYTWWGELELHETFDHGDLVEQVYKLDESMMDGVAKPIIYFYPEEETNISVQLAFDGKLSHTYPKYNHGWKVTASPDGTLKDQTEKEYYALYWEGHETTPLSIPNGTVLKGNETIAFLEEELPKMGLNAKETNEFIIYWMPHLENNKYNLIHFASTEYTNMAQLNVTPKPETMIRVMMVFQPSDLPVEIIKQNLSELYKERKGFTVVEWGGRQIQKPRL